MVSVLLLESVPLVPLVLHMVSIVEASVAECSWSSSLCLITWLCLLSNLGNKPKTELNILENVIGLLVAVTKFFAR